MRQCGGPTVPVVVTAEAEARHAAGPDTGSATAKEPASGRLSGDLPQGARHLLFGAFPARRLCDRGRDRGAPRPAPARPRLGRDDPPLSAPSRPVQGQPDQGRQVVEAGMPLHGNPPHTGKRRSLHPANIFSKGNSRKVVAFVRPTSNLHVVGPSERPYLPTAWLSRQIVLLLQMSRRQRLRCQARSGQHGLLCCLFRSTSIFSERRHPGTPSKRSVARIHSARRSRTLSRSISIPRPCRTIWPRDMTR
jgi:hypothetical protein